jgi:homoserine kinase
MSRVPGGRSVLVRVPASSANLGPGFDSIGLALGLWDHYVVSTTDAPGLLIAVSGEGADDVPTDERHLVHATMRHTWAVLGWEPPTGLRIEARNGVPHSRGLGSSATAIAAGVVAAQALSADSFPGQGEPVTIDRCLATHIASMLEGHPDNASASVLGGLTVSWMPDDSGLDRGVQTVTASIALHADVDVVVLVPETQLATRMARAVLPATVPLAAAAAGAGRAALLVHALTSDPDHLHAATRDWLHQEARRPAYPETMRLVDALRAQGHAAVVSGAGPSVLVLTTRAAAASVQAPQGSSGWQRLTPGVPEHGASVTVR